MTDHDENKQAGRPRGNFSRRRLLQGTGGALGVALASAGIYKMIDTIAEPPDRLDVAVNPPDQEQYVLQNEQVVKVNGSGVKSSNGTIPVRLPPLHDHVITATLNVPANATALQEAQHHLESVLLGLEHQFPPTPKGVGITVAWGLPYFSHYIPNLGKTSGFFTAGTPYPAYLPVDLMTSKTEGHTVYALQESRTFRSDQPPPGFGPVRLEQNDVAVLLRSDSLANIMAASDALFGAKGNQAGSLFKVTSIRRGFSGGGFFGHRGLPSQLALAAPGQSVADVARGVRRYHAYGHTGSMSQVDSTTSPTTSNYGVAYSTGTTIPVRGDFDTLDNPFFYTSDPAGDHYSKKKAAGLHFIVFQPTIAIVNRVRLAMDGHYSSNTLPVAPRSPHAGINSVLHTTHRQNYLVPPRRHRAFPLAEFLV